MPGSDFTIGNVVFNKMYLGDKPVYLSIEDGQETYPKSGLLNYFNANIEATTSSWGDTLTNTGSIFSTASIRYVQDLPSSSYYDFLSASIQSMYFGRAPLPSIESRTVLLWINPKKVGLDDYLQVVQYIGMAPSQNNAILIQSGGLAYRTTVGGLISAPATQGSFPSMSADTWYQVGYVYDNTNPTTITLFQNDMTSSILGNAEYSQNLYWEIGELSNTGRYSGSVAIQMIYNRALSHDEIKQSYDYFSQFYN